MNYYNLFSRSLKIQYHGQLFSEAMFFWILITLIRFILPLIIVWKSDGFWIKENQFREQPDVNFKKQFILIIETSDPEQIFGFSTFEFINQEFRQLNSWIAINVQVCDVYFGIKISDFNYDHFLFQKQLEFDNENDEKYDRLWFKLDVPFRFDRLEIIGIRLIGFFSYNLSSRIALQMESIFELNHNFNRSPRSLRIESDLEFIQNRPFQDRVPEYFYNRSMIFKATFDERFELEKFIRNYYNRHCRFYSMFE